MKRTVYIETTIPSYYHDERPEIAADTIRTRQWWDEERISYECFVSAVVVDELSEGTYPRQAECLQLIKGIPLLEINSEILEIAHVYHIRKLMPRPPVRDALHVALASYYRMDYLLTWNCRHLANVNKTRHLETLNQAMGLSVPALVTPDLLQPPEEDP